MIYGESEGRRRGSGMESRMEGTVHRQSLETACGYGRQLGQADRGSSYRRQHRRVGMALRVVFGADGGGTKTDCAVGRLDGTIVGFARVGPSNHLRLAGGAAEAARNVREGLERALADADRKSVV